MLFPNEFIQTEIKTSGAKINVIHGGVGKPLLLLHGYPQTNVIWHKTAPMLMDKFHVICPDLRGYGDSSKPKSTNNHSSYSKREMALDMIEMMKTLGYKDFFVAGHDRGARVVHRMILDHPKSVKRACVMDIAPTHYMFKNTNQAFATGYYHWFFLIQPDGLPEKMIGADPIYYLNEKLKRWSAPNTVFDKEAVSEYERCFSKPENIHSSCEDYRAAAGIDLIHDEEDINRKIEIPLLVLWGAKGFVHKSYEVLNVWKKYATNVEGKSLDCGHFLPEESPDEVYKELSDFFKDK